MTPRVFRDLAGEVAGRPTRPEQGRAEGEVAWRPRDRASQPVRFAGGYGRIDARLAPSKQEESAAA